jgi:hypothetical protein
MLILDVVAETTLGSAGDERSMDKRIVEEGEGKNQRIKSSDFILTLGLYRGQVEGQAKNPSAEVSFVV